MIESPSWFFVIGAQKAGTSTLHEWLAQSSEVSLPWTKETHFFRDEEWFSQGFEWYRKQFKNTKKNQTLFGEVDPEYMYFPECAERMRSICGAPKLIMVLRDPISRAKSHYLMSKRMGYEPLTFFDATVEEVGRLSGGDRFSQIHHSYVDRGLYAEQVERVKTQFPNSEILVLKFEDLYASQESAVKTLNLICNFIGIKSNEINVDVTVKHNNAVMPRFNSLRDFVYGKGKVKNFAGKFIHSRELKIRIMKFVDKMNMKAIDKTKLNAESDHNQCPHFVYEKLIRDLHKLQTIVDIDVSDWIDGYQILLDGK